MGSTLFPVVAPPQGGKPSLPGPGQPGPMTPGDFAGSARPNIVSFGFDKVGPPSTLYIQRDDVLALTVISQGGPILVNVTARILLPYPPPTGQPSDTKDKQPVGSVPVPGLGTVQPITQVFTVATARVPQTFTLQLAEGYLLSLTVNSSTTFRGSTWVEAWINRGPVQGVQPNAGALLCADYITQRHNAGWPSGRVISSLDGPGYLQKYTPSNPAVGTDINFTTNLLVRARLATVLATLVTSGTAGNRVVSFIITDPNAGVNVYRVQDSTALAASTTARYILAPGATIVRGAGAIATEQDITLPLPSPLFTNNGVQIQTSTQGILAADQWSATIINTEEWLDNY